jgi:PEP-CTERM motif
MKYWLLCTLLVVSIPSIVAADSIQITSTGATTVTVAGTGTTTYSNPNFNGWNIDIVFGVSSSPKVSPFGLELAAVVICTGGATCAANPLNIFYSDTNFNIAVPAGGFQTTYSATTTGVGTTNEIAWANSSNTLFALGATNKIGSIGPFSSPGGFGTASGGPAGTTPYSLTIEDIFTANGGAASYSTDANVTAATAAVPEPSSLALLASGLLLATFLKYRRWTPRT